MQHGGVAGARHAHVRRLHALGRVALQRRAHARRRRLLRCDTHTHTHTPVTHLTRLVTPTSLTRILDNPLEDETISNHFKHIRDFFLEGYLNRL